MPNPVAFIPPWKEGDKEIQYCGEKKLEAYWTETSGAFM
jgi:hypothetical protein